MSDSLNKTHTDIKTFQWIEALPSSMRPYIYLMRLDRPIGIWLLLLPSLWGVALASGGYQGMTSSTLYIIALFLFGAVIMRGAGCVINDLWDRNLDKMVERTKNRPIASGAVSVKNGIVFLATLLLFGLIVLLQMNIFTIILGFAALPLIIIYPLMKRITWWPQAFLGITFNFGALMGWSAVTGDLSLAPILLYIGGFFWTLAYDTIYAHQDIEDDVMAGIKSTARLFKERSKFWVAVFQGLCAVSIFCALIGEDINSIRISTLGLITMAIATLYIYRLMKSWNENNAESSLKAFKSNYILGLIFLLAILLN